MVSSCVLPRVISILLLIIAIKQKSQGAALACGQYNKALDMCCDGIIVRKKGPDGRCCANRGYDPRFQVCYLKIKDFIYALLLLQNTVTFFNYVFIINYT